MKWLIHCCLILSCVSNVEVVETCVPVTCAPDQVWDSYYCMCKMRDDAHLE